MARKCPKLLICLFQRSSFSPALLTLLLLLLLLRSFGGFVVDIHTLGHVVLPCHCRLLLFSDHDLRLGKLLEEGCLVAGVEFDKLVALLGYAETVFVHGSVHFYPNLAPFKLHFVADMQLCDRIGQREPTCFLGQNSRLPVRCCDRKLKPLDQSRGKFWEQVGVPQVLTTSNRAMRPGLVVLPSTQPSNLAMQQCADSTSVAFGMAAKICVFFLFGASISMLYRLMRSARSPLSPGNLRSYGVKNGMRH